MQEEIEQLTQENKIILDDALDKAKILHEDAITRASKIIADAENDAVNIREEARKQGYEEGLQEGNMEAMKRADIYLANIQQEQEKNQKENQAILEQAIAETEGQLVDFACDLIKKLTGILVNDYRPVMIHMINNALNEVENAKKFVIRVSEENYIYVSDNQDRLVGAANPNISIEIFGDSKLDNSQCTIESENGIIDLSMDVQIKNLITAIKLLS